MRTFTDAPTSLRHLMRREQHVHAVEQLDAGAYGNLVSRTALLHPNGETFDVSIGLRGLFQALTKISAQPEKDFGELVRRRRRKRGLPVTPAEKILPYLPAAGNDDPAARAALDAAAERMLENVLQEEELQVTRLRLAERRLAEAFTALEEAERSDAMPNLLTRLEAQYREALVEYVAAVSQQPPETWRIQER